jgi:DNA-binding response OmpR family regulator
MRILVIEDDSMLSTSLKKGLTLEGFSPELVGDLSSARLALRSTDSFAAIVLDINLPDGSGLDLLTELRKKSGSDIPVLLLTAQNTTATKVNALDIGADDYLSKPFDLGELAARLRAIIRRRHGHQDNLLHANGITLNLSTGMVTGANGLAFRPSAQELRLLTLLMQRPGKVVSKEKIEETFYGWDSGAESNIVEVIVYSLRKKLGKEAVITLRGVGYMVAA